MQSAKSNLVLIGMPGSGKSTVGIILAKRTARDFVDTDLLIQTSRQRSLQQIMDSEGYIALREIEAKVILRLNVHNHVIATGGSAVYSTAAMACLKHDGMCIFLDVAAEILRARISDYETRGIARRPEQSFTQLFAERRDLYLKYADLTIDCGRLNQDEVCDAIIAAIGGRYS